MKVRSFVVTNWNMNTREWFEKNKSQVRFVAFGSDVCPSSGRQHEQAFVHFHNPRSTSNKNLGVIGAEFGAFAHAGLGLDHFLAGDHLADHQPGSES